MKRIILASESPRRQHLLQQIGLEFICSPAYIEEDLSFSAFPHELVQTIASRKAKEAAHCWDQGIIIAADTVVASDGCIMGKPRDRGEAANMLICLSNRCHQVITGICIMDARSGRVETASESTAVFFRELSPGEINSYLDCGEWQDKAGAYAIQGRGALLIERIEGCYFNVVGLPLNRLHLMLREFGVDLWGGQRVAL
ncbi:MAG: septum formation protein Maf [Syntrophomonadaceae bacterium]|nr:septum formation protein Maf [Syntrophomonadaceae bacterium]